MGTRLFSAHAFRRTLSTNILHNLEEASWKQGRNTWISERYYAGNNCTPQNTIADTCREAPLQIADEALSRTKRSTISRAWTSKMIKVLTFGLPSNVHSMTCKALTFSERNKSDKSSLFVTQLHTMEIVIRVRLLSLQLVDGWTHKSNEILLVSKWNLKLSVVNVLKLPCRSCRPKKSCRPPGSFWEGSWTCWFSFFNSFFMAFLSPSATFRNASWPVSIWFNWLN